MLYRRVQADVDILVEEAKIKAVEVEHKVASANVFAEQVGVEKEKVNAENAAAQVGRGGGGTRGDAGRGVEERRGRGTR